MTLVADVLNQPGNRYGLLYGSADPTLPKNGHPRFSDPGKLMALTSFSFRSCHRSHLFDSFVSWQGVNGETDETRPHPHWSGLWKDTNLTGAERASHSLFFTQIFLGNIILRYLMRANFPLISAPSVFYARHYISFERVSLLKQLVDTLRIRTLDVG